MIDLKKIFFSITLMLVITSCSKESAAESYLD